MMNVNTLQHRESMHNVVTVFFQGNQASRNQATKYCGREGLDIFVSNNNVEHVYNPDSPKLLHNLFAYPELNDVVYGWSYNPLHWFFMLLHWIRQWQFNVYGTACVPHNKWSLMNIAGPEDVAQCLIAIKACINRNPEKKLVLFGTSRGASTILLTLARLSSEELLRIALVIVEAPFASVHTVLSETMPSPKQSVPIFTALLEYFTQYRRDQLTPLEVLATDVFPLTVPLVFVTSEADTTVPIGNTMHLITLLEQRRHNALHHIELKHSHHSWMSLQDKEDVQHYESELNVLYRKYIG